MKENKILIVEDEKHMQKVIIAYLKKAGFITKSTDNGEQALKLLTEFNPDLLILDLMLPGISGEEVCQKIRQHSDLAILILTAKGSFDSKVKCFNIGADDYLVKPFHPQELIARIKAIIRRSKTNSLKSEILYLANGKIIIDSKAMTVKVNGKDAQLTSTQFKLLYTLITHPNQVLSREQLADKTFGFDFDAYDRTIDAHIKNIRNKLSLKKDEYITTVYGAGYKFVSENNE